MPEASRSSRPRAVEYEASTAYGAVQAPLRSLFGLDGLEGTAAAERLAETVRKLAPRLLPWLPLLALPLGIEVPSTPEVDSLKDEFKKARVEEVVQELLGLGLLAPTLLIFEDVHWMDDASRDLLRRDRRPPRRPAVARRSLRRGRRKRG